MLMALALPLLLGLLEMAIQLTFYTIAAYYVAKYAHKGWRAGK